MRKGTNEQGRADCCFCNRDTLGESIVLVRNVMNPLGQQVSRAHLYHFVLEQNPRLMEMVGDVMTTEEITRQLIERVTNGT